MKYVTYQLKNNIIVIFTNKENTCLQIWSVKIINNIKFENSFDNFQLSITVKIHNHLTLLIWLNLIEEYKNISTGANNML